MHNLASQTDHQHISRQLLAMLPDLQQVYQDQCHFLQTLTPERCFEIDTEQQVLYLANRLFRLQLQLENEPLVCLESMVPGKSAVQFTEFVLQEVDFLTGDLRPQHSLFLRTKVQRFRQSLIEQVFAWIDGEQRVEACLQQISHEQAARIDVMMIGANYYHEPHLGYFLQRKQAIAPEVMANFKHMCLINSVQGGDFLPVQALMQHYEQLCLSMPLLLGAAECRVVELLFPERFSLQQLMMQQEVLWQWLKPAREQGNLLGFVALVQAQHWQRDDLLAKPHFLSAEAGWWEPDVGNLPLLHSSRAVNWLFRQQASVLDWISRHIQHPGVRCAITACSFLDTRAVHPQVLLLTLHYFQHVAASLWIQSCGQLAVRHGWFQHPENQQFMLYGQAGGQQPRRMISRSVLYLEEWQQLLLMVNGDHPERVWKSSYQPLSRIMQAYMRHLQHIAEQLPAELVEFINPKSQQQRDFYARLQQHQLDVSSFRQLFYLRDAQQRISVFDSYVRDYLAEYLNNHPVVPKNVSWQGLFQQAIIWHGQIQRQNILAKLRQGGSLMHWAPMTQTGQILWGDWMFEELHSIDRIIQESSLFQHCLASSYTQRIIDGEYVAFHMQHRHKSELAYTLGCHYRAGNFEFDQLELPRNRKADAAFVLIAQKFVARLNAQMNPQQLDE